MATFEGTSLINFYWRLLGARIGDYTLFYDFINYTDIDFMTVGSDVVICGYPFQIHSFEDRVFWVDQVKIGDGSCLGVTGRRQNISHLNYAKTSHISIFFSPFLVLRKVLLVLRKVLWRRPYTELRDNGRKYRTTKYDFTRELCAVEKAVVRHRCFG